LLRYRLLESRIVEEMKGGFLREKGWEDDGDDEWWDGFENVEGADDRDDRIAVVFRRDGGGGEIGRVDFSDALERMFEGGDVAAATAVALE
jgi:hypothetical protein